MAEYNSQVMLCSGLPGAGKTLSTIVRVKEWADSTKRKVYYSRINQLTLDWEQWDADKWYEVPDGSIVVIDEAQKGELSKDWKPEAKLRVVNGDAPQLKTARAVTEIETLRHRGINLVLITQHPMLLHPNVRRLCGLHYHAVRTFGMQQAMIYEWHAVQASPESAGAKAQAIKHVFKYPKWAYEVYKSAEVHTIRRRIPMKVKLLLCLPFVLAGLGYIGYQKIVVEKLGANRQIEKLNGGAMPGPGQQGFGAGQGARVKTQAEWMAEHQPRIQGLPSTAPVYDKIMEAKIAPKPVACVSGGSRCSCYSQQGTKMPQVPELTCRSIVANGYFDDAPDRPPERSSDFRAGQPVVLAASPTLTETRAPLMQTSGQAVAVGSRETPWVADPRVRQAVTAPTRK